MRKETTEIKEFSKKSSEQLTSAVAKIKQVCSDYFLNYETGLEEMRIRTHVLENKYTDWSKVLIEPQSLNDARLFAIETRCQEEEDVRIKEYNFLRDLVKKLIYSLEQKDLDQFNPDSLQVPRTSYGTTTTSKLPSLMGTKGGANAIDTRD